MTSDPLAFAWFCLGVLACWCLVATLVLVAIWNLVGSYAVRGLGEAWRRELKRALSLKK